MKLKPLIFLAGAAAATAAAIKRRGGAQAIPNAVQSAASAAPEPVRQAAQAAADTVQKAVDTVTPGDSGSDEPKERYEPPVEGLAQEPRTPGGPPSTEATSIDAPHIVTDPSFELNEPEHPLPEGAVMPDTSEDDPLVRREVAAAEGDAGAIGGNVDALAAEDESFPRDQASRPVIEGEGDESEETFEEREDIERGNREIEP
jgi:hypothetical protein